MGCKSHSYKDLYFDEWILNNNYGRRIFAMKLIKRAAKVMAKVSSKSAVAVSSSVSLAGYHQPKEPESLKNFKFSK